MYPDDVRKPFWVRRKTAGPASKVCLSGGCSFKFITGVDYLLAQIAGRKRGGLMRGLRQRANFINFLELRGITMQDTSRRRITSKRSSCEQIMTCTRLLTTLQRGSYDRLITIKDDTYN